MSLKIKDMPEAERPYEKLELYGAEHLSNAELLAIIIKNGTKEETSVELAQKVLKLRENGLKDDLSFLKKLSINDFIKIKGIGKVKAIQLKAICELAIRMSKPANYKGIIIRSPKDVADMLLDELKDEKHEISKIFLLDNRNRILRIETLGIGGSNFVDVGIKQIITLSLKVEANKVILVHNHPTGISTPSEADIKFTDKLYNALAIFEIDLLDHIVIGDMNYVSIYEQLQTQIEDLKKNKSKH